jgi:hypothetical protein
MKKVDFVKTEEIMVPQYIDGIETGMVPEIIKTEESISGMVLSPDVYSFEDFMSILSSQEYEKVRQIYEKDLIAASSKMPEGARVVVWWNDRIIMKGSFPFNGWFNDYDLPMSPEEEE